MSYLYTNNAVSTLASGLSIGATSLSVQAGDGALFPNPTGNDFFLVTLQDASNNIEIVRCTGRTTDQLTIVRAQEGTTDQAWLAGDSVELRLTAASLNSYRQGAGDKVVDTAINKSLAVSDVHDFINVTAAATITLPDAATAAEGYQITIKNNSSGLVTINRATAGDTIDGVVVDKTIGPNSTIYFSVNSTEDGYISMHSAVEAAYPVGAVYMSTVSTSPATILGFGVWTQVGGRFLVGVGTADGKAYTALEEGGQKDAIIPNHTHPITDPGHTHTDSGASQGDADGSPNGQNWSGTHQTQSATTGITVDNPVGGEAVTDKNLPPYFAVYIWYRTS